MIPLGTVTLESGAVAELMSDWTWRVRPPEGGDEADAEAAELLAGLFTLQYRDAYAGPQDGAPGELILNDLARRMKGTARYTGPGSSAEPGRVY
jgi:hypothetical protein